MIISPQHVIYLQEDFAKNWNALYFFVNGS